MHALYGGEIFFQFHLKLNYNLFFDQFQHLHRHK